MPGLSGYRSAAADLNPPCACRTLLLYSHVAPTHTVCPAASSQRILMQAIITSGGKQYMVSPGKTIRVEKLTGDLGSEIEIPATVAFQEGGDLVKGATVKATIVGNGRGDKVIVFKFKRKKKYKKTIGHRQSFTELK